MGPTADVVGGGQGSEDRRVSRQVRQALRRVSRQR